ncbi:PDZ domain-containing protein [Stieleria sp. JC731]|uniref:PDZ domain-containing protein n=1 Tax=Pirellulaceae TaxID=2691357 RepID=UPI001E543B64|nr:PDZ domain-containing protein [Stieleria sp. JC731]MCC9599214.1 PDZ domain-containing protein [Stieleria sp. JC731]
MKLRSKLAAVGASVALLAPAVQAQNIGGAISNAVQDRLSPGNPITNGTPVENGIRRATGSVLNGSNLNQAVRDGINETARSVEQRAYTNGGIQADGSIRATNQAYVNGQSRSMYQGNDGRWFYLNSNGQAVYTNAPMHSSSQQYDNRTSGHAQYYGHQNNYSTNGNVAYQSQQRGRLGASIEETDQGVRVTSVSQGSAAERAGLRTGDMIITANGQKIESPTALGQRIADADANSQMTFVVKRDGREQELQASLGAKVSSEGENWNGSGQMHSQAALSTRVNQLEQELNRLRTNIDTLRRDIDAGAENAMTAAEQTTDAVSNEAQETAEDVTATASNAANEASETANEAADTVEETAKSTTETVRNTTDKAVNKASDAAKKAGNSVENATKSVSESLGFDQ